MQKNLVVERRVSLTTLSL